MYDLDGDIPQSEHMAILQLVHLVSDSLGCRSLAHVDADLSVKAASNEIGVEMCVKDSFYGGLSALAVGNKRLKVKWWVYEYGFSAALEVVGEDGQLRSLELCEIEAVAFEVVDEGRGMRTCLLHIYYEISC